MVHRALKKKVRSKKNYEKLQCQMKSIKEEIKSIKEEITYIELTKQNSQIQFKISSSFHTLMLATVGLDVVI